MSDLRSELTGIYRRRGELTPQLVVDESRPDNAPLHDRFEWDDSVAGEKYRCVQASSMIRAVRIEFPNKNTGESQYLRAFFSKRESNVDQDGAGYVPVDEIVQDDIALKILLANFQRDLAEIKRKYSHLSEYAEMLRQAIA